jgi:hypothetical protein
MADKHQAQPPRIAQSSSDEEEKDMMSFTLPIVPDTVTISSSTKCHPVSDDDTTMSMESDSSSLPRTAVGEVRRLANDASEIIDHMRSLAETLKREIVFLKELLATQNAQLKQISATKQQTYDFLVSVTQQSAEQSTAVTFTQANFPPSQLDTDGPIDWKDAVERFEQSEQVIVGLVPKSQSLQSVILP